ncbi:MAG: hypothetical protein ACOVOS_01000 [Chitinophagaceae bacterium]|jgi:hypothetical protein
MQKSPSLAFCILMDLIGLATFAVPVLGEFGDILWAPISALIFYKSFGGTKGMLGGMFNFLEEILPGFDFIPTFTIMYFMTRKKTANTAVLVK